MSDTIVYYVVYGSGHRNVTPEIDTGGHNPSFPVGYQFIVEKYGDYSDAIHTGDVHFQSDNLIQARIKFLKLKIEDMDKNGMDHYMPKTFKSFVVEYNDFIEKYPEHAI